MVQACGKTETAVVLGQCFFLIPTQNLSDFAGREDLDDVPVLCDDGVLQDLLLGRALLPLLRDRRLVLAFLKFATHFRELLMSVEAQGVCGVEALAPRRTGRAFSKILERTLTALSITHQGPGTSPTIRHP